MAVHYDGVPFAVMMASPGDLVDFAHGFSLTERGIPSGDIVEVDVRDVLEGIVLDIRTTCPASVTVSSEQARLMPGRSGCGICGNRLLEDVVRQPAAVGEGVVLEAQALELALAALHGRQPLNAVTGAIHAAAWCDIDGAVIQVREDVGRHNALDKLIGAMSAAGIDAGHGLHRHQPASFELRERRKSDHCSPRSRADRVGVDWRVIRADPAGFVLPGRHGVQHRGGLLPVVGACRMLDPAPELRASSDLQSGCPHPASSQWSGG